MSGASVEVAMAVTQPPWPFISPLRTIRSVGTAACGAAAMADKQKGAKLLTFCGLARFFLCTCVCRQRGALHRVFSDRWRHVQFVGARGFRRSLFFNHCPACLLHRFDGVIRRSCRGPVRCATKELMTACGPGTGACTVSVDRAS